MYIPLSKLYYLLERIDRHKYIVYTTSKPTIIEHSCWISDFTSFTLVPTSIIILLERHFILGKV